MGKEAVMRRWFDIRRVMIADEVEAHFKVRPKSCPFCASRSFVTVGVVDVSGIQHRSSISRKTRSRRKSEKGQSGESPVDPRTQASLK